MIFMEFKYVKSEEMKGYATLDVPGDGQFLVPILEIGKSLPSHVLRIIGEDPIMGRTQTVPITNSKRLERLTAQIAEQVGNLS